MLHTPSPDDALVEALAFVYFFVAEHGDDHGLTPDERVRITETLARWTALGSHSAPGARIEQAMERALPQVKGTSDEATLTALHQHARVIRQRLASDDHRKAVLYDMASVSRADGVVTQGERELVTLVQRLLLAP
ncbi:MAG: TerB family tellurite resistance protein [Deltaproteobacteria bacterium]|nr:TerB family tellurite resistance protein [Deltaproteobacteria bacterium]